MQFLLHFWFVVKGAYHAQQAITHLLPLSHFGPTIPDMVSHRFNTRAFFCLGRKSSQWVLECP